MEAATTDPFTPTNAPPPVFLSFLASQGLTLEDCLPDAPTNRFFRIRADPSQHDEIVRELEKELECTPAPVAWLPNFYSIPADVKISSTEAYKKGFIFGMDASSGVAVMALDVQPHHHVLDLCAAPGAKLCLIYDTMLALASSSLSSSSSPSSQTASSSPDVFPGTITGVDISKDRLATCKSILKKCRVNRARLYATDGTTFDVGAPVLVRRRAAVGASLPKAGDSDDASPNISLGEDEDDLAHPVQQIDTQNTPAPLLTSNDTSAKTVSDRTTPPAFSHQKPFHIPRLLRLPPSPTPILYDRVLVDAECTHEGSSVHLRKYTGWWDWSRFEEKFFGEGRVEGLPEMQGRLLENAWRMVKPGGLVVYSTCSLAPTQNEHVLLPFLHAHPTARLERIPGWEDRPASQPKADGLEGAERFEWRKSGTKGFFVARVRKLE
ncbi:S-adenosyl-L-methionine-dependent methyltransferase [Gonapodya prolifera JEL478]|uniref:S-adenosyl-L-methionine-dependent methyltransferase n=1 Tax=Gonapodya prolifera (strain JEL478) TaxID=1344416 RepID=A0A138ZXZ8_GONPJ|nr:S-adenosyl-L-methionine-dependent methyltransferase [Gonapodya prolifera JEL478]|eukprot:KXS09013.1 S-adenosyl-L-methionine-dependent methyltransferase [Gonapodya prolifera JEL478]